MNTKLNSKCLIVKQDNSDIRFQYILSVRCKYFSNGLFVRQRAVYFVDDQKTHSAVTGMLFARGRSYPVQ